jgi:gluconolactonase
MLQVHSPTNKIMRTLKLLTFGLALACSITAQTYAQETSAAGLDALIATGAKLKLVTDQCKFTEGPIADSGGRVFFTDQPNNRIMLIDLEGKVSTWMEDAGRSNGMYFDVDWNLVTCADENNELWMIWSDRRHEAFLQGGEKPFNGPNDLWISNNNVIYFTDPYYKRDWWQSNEAPREIRGLYRCEIDGSDLKLLDGNFKQPNGIIGDWKRKLLYVADIDDRKIYVYPINDDDSLGERKLFCEDASDGMTIDEQGNVYLTNSKGVVVFSKEGKLLGTIPTGESWTANVCFGGEGHKTLFITASDSVYSLKMNVSGKRPDVEF